MGCGHIGLTRDDLFSEPASLADMVSPVSAEVRAVAEAFTGTADQSGGSALGPSLAAQIGASLAISLLGVDGALKFAQALKAMSASEDQSVPSESSDEPSETGSAAERTETDSPKQSQSQSFGYWDGPTGGGDVGAGGGYSYAVSPASETAVPVGAGHHSGDGDAGTGHSSGSGDAGAGHGSGSGYSYSSDPSGSDPYSSDPCSSDSGSSGDGAGGGDSGGGDSGGRFSGRDDAGGRDSLGGDGNIGGNGAPSASDPDDQGIEEKVSEYAEKIKERYETDPGGLDDYLDKDLNSTQNQLKHLHVKDIHFPEKKKGVLYFGFTDRTPGYKVVQRLLPVFEDRFPLLADLSPEDIRSLSTALTDEFAEAVDCSGLSTHPGLDRTIRKRVTKGRIEKSLLGAISDYKKREEIGNYQPELETFASGVVSDMEDAITLVLLVILLGIADIQDEDTKTSE